MYISTNIYITPQSERGTADHHRRGILLDNRPHSSTTRVSVQIIHMYAALFYVCYSIEQLQNLFTCVNSRMVQHFKIFLFRFFVTWYNFLTFTWCENLHKFLV